MPLSADEIVLIVRECRPLLLGALVDDVRAPDDHSLLVTLRSTQGRSYFLLFSVRPGFARLHLVPERPRAVSQAPPFVEPIRSALRDARLIELRQVSGDRIVEASFQTLAVAGIGQAASIVLEAIGSRGQLVLLDAGRRLLASVHPVRRGKESVDVGAVYRFPEARPRRPQLRAVPPAPSLYLAPGEANAWAESPAHWNFLLGQYYGRRESEEEFRERKERLLARLQRDVERAKGTLEKIARDREAAEAADVHRRKGELLKGALGRIRRGMASIEVDDYFHPELRKVVVELDAALSPRENVERCFRLYQKARRAVPILEARRRKIAGDLARAEALLAKASAAEDIAAVVAVEEEPSVRAATARSKKPKGPRRTAPQGPRHFVSKDGWEILVGRNARQNDELTLRVARGNDLFLHVAGRAGGHVIVRSPTGKLPPTETLLDAANLALYYSLPDRQRRGQALSAGGEVDYTQVKHVRKPKGAKPGLLLLASRKTLRIRLELERLERLRRQLEELEAPPPGN